MAKVPPLKCPQCDSTKVKPGFAKKKGHAWVRDAKIWCYDCKKVTDTKTSKVKIHKFSSHRFEQEDT